MNILTNLETWNILVVSEWRSGTKRPNSGGAGTAKDKTQYSEESLKLAEEKEDIRFCEPIWIWEKK